MKLTALERFEAERNGFSEAELLAYRESRNRVGPVAGNVITTFRRGTPAPRIENCTAFSPLRPGGADPHRHWRRKR